MMPLEHRSSPHSTTSNKTDRMMLLVLIALLPALCVRTFCFGWGTPITLLWCSLIALGSEAVLLALRRRAPLFYLRDKSALVTAWLLALSLPPDLPWWCSLIGTSFAMVFGKHIYGGLGQNPFNPAMLGYVLLLISFPLPMSSWSPADGTGHPWLTFSDSLQLIFLGKPIDGWTMATPLDLLRNNNTLTLPELWSTHRQLSGLVGPGWLPVNLACLAGGLWLLKKKVIQWQAPVGMLAGLAIMSLIFWNGSGSASRGSPLFHWFSGGTMLCAFFIVTDPVSGTSTRRGQLLFGLGAGLLTYTIRAFGGYPDALAFATLLMNMSAPAMDYWIRPRTLGHGPHLKERR